MTVTIVLHSDRHADPEVFVFADTAAAIEWAKARAKEFDRFDDLDERLTSAMQRDGWLYFARYGEDNTIRVQTVDVR